MERAVGRGLAIVEGFQLGGLEHKLVRGHEHLYHVHAVVGIGRDIRDEFLFGRLLHGDGNHVVAQGAHAFAVHGYVEGHLCDAFLEVDAGGHGVIAGGKDLEIGPVRSIVVFQPIGVFDFQLAGEIPAVCVDAELYAVGIGVLHFAVFVVGVGIHAHVGEGEIGNGDFRREHQQIDFVADFPLGGEELEAHHIVALREHVHERADLVGLHFNLDNARTLVGGELNLERMPGQGRCLILFPETEQITGNGGVVRVIHGIVHGDGILVHGVNFQGDSTFQVAAAFAHNQGVDTVLSGAVERDFLLAAVAEVGHGLVVLHVVVPVVFAGDGQRGGCYQQQGLKYRSFHLASCLKFTSHSSAS